MSGQQQTSGNNNNNQNRGQGEATHHEARATGVSPQSDRRLITHVSSSENQAHRRNNGESSTSEQSAKNSKAIEDGLFKIMHSAMANYESECDQQHELDKDKLALLECEDELEARRGSK